MEEVYKTLLVELTKAFLSIENAPNAHPRLKKALADALKPPPPPKEEEKPPPPPPIIMPKLNAQSPPITLKKDD